MTDINHHFEQQLLVEQWSKDRGYLIDNAPDFTDYLSRFKGLITDYREIDFYYAWFKQ